MELLGFEVLERGITLPKGRVKKLVV